MAEQSAGARGAPDPRALRHRFPANPTASVSARVIPLPGPVWLIAASMAVVLLSFANDYGFNRDELYFVLAGRHPDFGYVDQPPLTPLISAAEAALFGLSPLALRVAPAITAAAGVVLSADIARRLGASRTAQVLTALVVAISGWLAVATSMRQRLTTSCSGPSHSGCSCRCSTIALATPRRIAGAGSRSGSSAGWP